MACSGDHPRAERSPADEDRREAVASFADSDFDFEEWRVVDGPQFSDIQEPPLGHLYVEFRYRAPDSPDGERHRPGREVHVYGPDGEVLDCHDFG